METSAAAPPESKPAETRSRRSKTPLLIAAAFLSLVAGLLYWLHARHFEETDDAAVDGHFAALSTRVSGTVSYVNPDIENDRPVSAGTLLIELDPRDLEAALEHARATLVTKQAEARVAALQVPIISASAYSQLHLAEASHQEALASVAAAEAELATAQHRVLLDQALAGRAERERARYETLVGKHEISRSFFDARSTDAASTMQVLMSDQAGVTAATQKIAQVRSLVLERQAQIANARTAPQQVLNAEAQSSSVQGEVAQALADVHTAELNLGYAKIYAPVAGIVGHKTVEPGHRVQPGQTLLTVVPTDDIWITANFKETQLRLMHPGQPVEISVDTLGRDLQGEVEDMAGASGPLFSLFPPENASGNFVKIVQRFPVRIRLARDQDPHHQLRPGMSVEASVKVR